MRFYSLLNKPLVPRTRSHAHASRESPHTTTRDTSQHGNQLGTGHNESRTLRDCDAAAPSKLLSVCVRRGRPPEAIYCCTFGHSRAWVSG